MKEIKICPICQKEFEGRKDQVYCRRNNNACRQEGYRRRKKDDKQVQSENVGTKVNDTKQELEKSIADISNSIKIKEKEKKQSEQIKLGKLKIIETNDERMKGLYNFFDSTNIQYQKSWNQFQEQWSRTTEEILEDRYEKMSFGKGLLELLREYNNQEYLDSLREKIEEDRVKYQNNLNSQENKVNELAMNYSNEKNKCKSQNLSIQDEIVQLEKKIYDKDEELKKLKNELKIKQEAYKKYQIEEIQSKGFMTREERNLVRSLRPNFQFKDKWKAFIGFPENPFDIRIYGKPGQGKGFFACEFANYLTTFGKVLYDSPEEGNSTNLDVKLDLFDVTDDPNKFITAADSNFDSLKKTIEYTSPNFVIIDSISKIAGLEDKEMEELRKLFPIISFLSIIQTNKAGKAKGRQELLHNCDAVFEVKKGIVYNRKNRFPEWTEEEFKITFPNQSNDVD